MPATDLPLLIDAAREAAVIANRFWKTDQQIWHKHDNAGPVSEGDYAVDTYLRERLTAARPRYGWLSEETEDDPARLQADTVFIVDPIDGTRSYVAGEPTWAHSLAVVRNGRPTAAAVYLPQRGKLYTASLGGGARLNDRPLVASSRSLLEGADILAPKPSLEPQHWQGMPPAVNRHFRPSLAYRLCLVAEGRFDAMLTLRDCWEWDIAGGALIATEAGATVTDRFGAPLAFNSARAKTSGVLTASPALHAELHARLSPPV